MLIDLGLSTQYWPKAIHTAVYLRNLVSSKQNLNVVPVEAWYRMKQDVSHLHAFEVTAYAHIFQDLHTSKLGPCVTHLVLIGYFS